MGSCQDESAVVGSEDDEGLVGDPGFLQGAKDATDGGVEAFEHGGVGRVGLKTADFGGLGLVFLDEVGLGLEWGVDGVRPVIERKDCPL